MVLGELGNFAAYSFAPASLVAPLGMTTVLGRRYSINREISHFHAVAQLQVVLFDFILIVCRILAGPFL